MHVGSIDNPETKAGRLYRVLEDSVAYMEDCAEPRKRKSKDLGAMVDGNGQVYYGRWLAAKCREYLAAHGSGLPAEPEYGAGRRGRRKASRLPQGAMMGMWSCLDIAGMVWCFLGHWGVGLC